jgi:hypothetical protein
VVNELADCDRGGTACAEIREEKEEIEICCDLCGHISAISIVVHFSDDSDSWISVTAAESHQQTENYNYEQANRIGGWSSLDR